MKKGILLAFALIMSVAGFSQTQKFGYVNSVGLLSDLPEVKQADSDLQAYQAQLQKQGQQKVQEYQTKAQDLEKRKADGVVSPKEYETEAAKMGKMEEELKALEQTMMSDLSKRKEDSYKPILDKVNKAIADVAKEGGFLMVLDSSTGVLLFAEEALDVTKLVRTKLGLAN